VTATGADRWEDEARELGVTSANWLEGPFNRLGFRRVEKLVRTALIPRGDGPVFELPRAGRDLSGFRFDHEGRSLDLESMLAATFTDGFLVIQDGAAVYERYFGGFVASDRHLLMSVSKSFNATLCGVLVGRGALAPADLVTDHVAELRGTAWEGCTVQHLLDMRAGVRWDFDVDEYTILDVSDYRAHDRTGIPPDTAAWIRAIPVGSGHGGPFAYNSLSADVLGWVLERAGGTAYPQLFSDCIWSRLGAEQDAQIMLDRKGFPIVEGGFCATLRDLARFGLMWLGDGALGDRQIVPREWTARLLVREQELIDAYGGPGEIGGTTQDAFYHDNWWIWDAERGVYAAFGMNGQGVFVHRPARTVLAKLSTFPEALDPELVKLHDAGMAALCEWLV
jgi:CubicO group peptidase (beta-lactamase class C family)